MSFNIRDYVSDDHVESIGEIAKSQSAIIQALSLDNSKKDKEIKRLKEDSEYLNKVNIELSTEKNRLNNIINGLEKWLVESIEKRTEDYLDWKYDRNVYLAGIEKLQNVFDKLQELKGSNGAIPPEVIGTNGEDGGLFDYGDR